MSKRPGKQKWQNPSQAEHYVDAHAVARHIGIKRRQVLALTRAKKLPGHPVDPDAACKTWRYKLSEIDRAIAQAAKKPLTSTPKMGLGADRSPDNNTCGSPRSRKEQSNG